MNELYWLPALSLVTLPWARPFLPVLGLPRPLLEQLEVWEPIYLGAVTEYQTRRNVHNWIQNKSAERSELLRQVVTEALLELADQLGQSVALALES